MSAAVRSNRAGWKNCGKFQRSNNHDDHSFSCARYGYTFIGQTECSRNIWIPNDCCTKHIAPQVNDSSFKFFVAKLCWCSHTSFMCNVMNECLPFFSSHDCKQHVFSFTVSVLANFRRNCVGYQRSISIDCDLVSNGKMQFAILVPFTVVN